MTRKQGSIIFLKAVLLFIILLALAFCIFGLPVMASRDAAAHPVTAYLQYPFLICSYILFSTFFIALHQTYKLLNYIDRNEAFSELSINALKYIKYCASAISCFFVAGLFILILLIKGDIAGMITLCLLCTFASSVIATFAAVLQKLLKAAIDIKSENDLTV
ncbi:Protein of unknown function (DUF2975) [Planomicrobium soli]|uniref:DUF2975 family protein n=1 Tax=Planomicrobium soli TaxID=1176648 RepID=A0A2P8H1T3_9BACL|nr:DUF2975 domain-containing protein [Planomicrobium soli]PSL40171.1 Protein of unknown function (DUF2975) [Planomicrobium soli]